MADGRAPSLDELGTTVWGLDPNVAAALAYAVGWVSGVVLLVFEPNKFVRFHALQSTIVFGGLSLAWMVALLSVPSSAGSSPSSSSRRSPPCSGCC